MVEKTTQDISRTCFAWQPTHEVPKTRKSIAWFEILRSDDVTSPTTTFNVNVETRSATDPKKCYRLDFSNAQVAMALQPIRELGIKADGSGFDPVVVETPPDWLDSFFETLAGLFEQAGMAPSQISVPELAAFGQRAYLSVTTRDPPKPPPVVGHGWSGVRRL